MSSLERIVQIRDAVTGLCGAIDAGDVRPTELEMLAIAYVVVQHGGPFTHDLVCQLASRCENGRKLLDKIKQ